MPKTYTTTQGDMWDSIAYKALGSVNLTDKLMMANRRYLHLYTFPAGVVLDVPEIKAESVADGLPPWKKTKG